MSPTELLNHFKGKLDFDDRNKLIELTNAVQYASYDLGFRDALRCFAHWKDGTQYVGTCGKTLEDATEGRRRLCEYDGMVDWNVDLEEFTKAGKRQT